MALSNKNEIEKFVEQAEEEQRNKKSSIEASLYDETYDECLEYLELIKKHLDKGGIPCKIENGRECPYLSFPWTMTKVFCKADDKNLDYEPYAFPGLWSSKADAKYAIEKVGKLYDKIFDSYYRFKTKEILSELYDRINKDLIFNLKHDFFIGKELETICKSGSPHLKEFGFDENGNLSDEEKEKLMGKLKTYYAEVIKGQKSALKNIQKYINHANKKSDEYADSLQFYEYFTSLENPLDLSADSIVMRRVLDDVSVYIEAVMKERAVEEVKEIGDPFAEPDNSPAPSEPERE